MQLFIDLNPSRSLLELPPNHPHGFVTITCIIKQISLTVWDIAMVCPSCGNLHRMLIQNLCGPLVDLQQSLWLLQVLAISIPMDLSCLLLSSLFQLSLCLSRAYLSTVSLLGPKILQRHANNFCLFSDAHKRYLQRTSYQTPSRTIVLLLDVGS